MAAPLPTLALTLALLLWAGASPTRATEPAGARRPLAQARRELRDIQRQMDASISELRPLLERFHALADGFDAAQDTGTVARLEQSELGPLVGKFSRLNHIFSEYARAKSSEEHLLARHLAGTSVQEATSGAISEYSRNEAYWDRCALLIRQAMRGEQEARERRDAALLRIETARRARERSELLRRRGTLLGRGLFPLATLAGLLLWKRGKSRAIASPRVAAPAPALPGPGTVLADTYRLERELGRGGMGVVYEATDLALGRKVAVKSALDGLAQDPRELEAVLKEARSVAALKHPNIVSIYTVLREAGNVYLVFELVEGRTLAQYVSSGKGLPLKFVKSVLRQVCSALEHAHGRGVVHRDLKPSNVMVLADGRVKVMDFGIARLTQAAASGLTATRPMGTPLYMAPEQELGSVSKASDIFALGVCAYEMLTGARPFPGPDFLGQKRRMDFAPPSSLVQGLPPAVDGLLRKAVHAEPGSRFRSAGEFAEEFERL